MRFDCLARAPLAIALLSCLGLHAHAAENAAPVAGDSWVYVGSYAGPRSKGIYVSRLSSQDGKLSVAELAAETRNPSFLAVHPSGRFLYAVGESADLGTYQGKPSGAVSAFAIDRRTGKLTHLNSQSSAGAGPCHLVVDKAGKNVLVANYGGGSIACLPLGEDGRLAAPSSAIQHTGSSVNAKRQSTPHAHSINLDSANRFAFAADLGLDRVLVYRFDAAKGSLVPNEPAGASLAPGSGPRHFAFHPGGRFAYVINEIVCTMTAFGYDSSRGQLKEIQTLSTLPPGESVKPGYSTAEVVAHSSGKFLYGSNRGHDTIVVYTVDPQTGLLNYVANTPTGGKTPRNFAIDPSGTWLLAENQGSDSIVVFRIDAGTGRLTSTGHSLQVGSPVCVRFVPVQ